MSSRPGLPNLRPVTGRRAEARARQRLQRRLSAGKENPARAEERLGVPSAPRPEGPLIWLHSQTEADALEHLSLVGRLRMERDDLNFLVTTAQYDPESPLSGHMPNTCLHQYLPYEEGGGITRFLTHWHPDACIWLDPDLRPPIIEAAATTGLPLFWAEARMSDDKSHKLRWIPGAPRRVLGHFQHVLAVDGRSARNLKRLGVPEDRIAVLGSLHEAAPPLECEESEREALTALLATRPVWLAANVAVSEEAAVTGAHRSVSRRAHRHLLIVVPSNLARGPDLAQKLERNGWVVGLRSAGQKPTPDTQIFVADREGEMGLWFRLAPISFFGQTLTGTTGQPLDPYQATALGSVVLFGPETGTFTPRFARLHAAGAACKVAGKKSLSAELEYLLALDKVAEMAQAAWNVSTAGAEASDRLCALVHEALDARGV